MHPLDHVIAALLLLWPPIWGTTFGYRRLATAPSERLGVVRPAVYRTAIALQWGMTALVLVYWFATHRGIREIGLMPLLLGRAGAPPSVAEGDGNAEREQGEKGGHRHIWRGSPCSKC